MRHKTDTQNVLKQAHKQRCNVRFGRFCNECYIIIEKKIIVLNTIKVKFAFFDEKSL